MRFFSKQGDTRLQMVLRAIFVSGLFTAGVAWIWRASPIVTTIYTNDSLYLSRAMTLLFLYMLALTLRYIIQISRELSLVHNYVRLKAAGAHVEAAVSIAQHPNTLVYITSEALQKTTDKDVRGEVIDIVRDISEEKIMRVRLHGTTLINLGLLGTLVGMILAFNISFGSSSEVDPASVLNSVVAALKFSVGTSIVGVIGKMWLAYLQNILEEGVRHLMINLVKLEILS